MENHAETSVETSVEKIAETSVETSAETSVENSGTLTAGGTTGRQTPITVSVSRRNAVEADVPDELPDESPADGFAEDAPGENAVEAVESADEEESVGEAVDEADSDDGYEDDEDEPGSRGFNYEKAVKIGCISCGGVLVLLIAALATFTAVFMHFYNLMETDTGEELVIHDKVTFSDTEIAEIPEGNVALEEGEVFRNGDVFNVLLIGTDDRTKTFSSNARADSVMLVSLSKRDSTVRLVSFERGMLVSIPGHKDDILTHTFRYGGSKLLLETVRTHFKVDVDKYIRVNFAMFQKLVDEVGGVDISLTEKEAYGLNKYPNHNTWKLDRKVYPGMNHFNGYEALQYARLRWIDDDFHRIERQRKVILAIKDNMTDLSVGDLTDVCEDCLPYVQTNLSAMECAGLLLQLPGYMNGEAEQLTIPQKGTYKTLGHVDFKANEEIIREFLYG